MLTFIQEKFLTGPIRHIVPFLHLNSDLVGSVIITYAKGTVVFGDFCAACHNRPFISVPEDRKQSPN